MTPVGIGQQSSEARDPNSSPCRAEIYQYCTDICQKILQRILSLRTTFFGTMRQTICDKKLRYTPLRQ